MHRDCPEHIRVRLRAVQVRYIAMCGDIEIGTLIVDERLVGDIEAIFALALCIEYRFTSIVPIHVYNWDDTLSMSANNSSGFNYRCVEGTYELSLHAFGMAVDLNPLRNPMIMRGVMHPACGIADTNHESSLFPDHPIVIRFKELGWTWGGDWTEPYDPHHFQKDLRTAAI
ncbi:M15 family metallopeptidase [Candidatus Uhrbacteria bacterium]|nr:M15 family metallopeptidase [Candidatus Uhrbacteria bacterium]